MRLARGACRAPASAWARLGLANLHRPGTPAPLMLVSVGLGLSTLAAVALIQGNRAPRSRSSRCRPTRRASSSSTSRTTSSPASTQLVRGQPGRQPTCSRCRRLRARIVAVNGVPAEQVQRHAGHALGAARRPRPDLCRDAAGGHAASSPGSGGRPTTRGPPLVSFDAGLARGWGVRRRRHHPGERAGPRHRPAHRQPARHRLAQPGAELRHGRQPRPAGATRRTRISPPCACRSRDAGRAAARGDRRAAERHRHPGRRRAGARWRRCWTRWRRRWPRPAR